MGIVHISRAEAASDFEGLVARAARGDEVLIESSERVIARLLPANAPHTRLLSDSLKILQERGSTATLDGNFARDLEHVINDKAICFYRRCSFGEDHAVSSSTIPHSR